MTKIKHIFQSVTCCLILKVQIDALVKQNDKNGNKGE